MSAEQDLPAETTPTALRDLAVSLVADTAAVIRAKRAELTAEHDIREFTQTKSSAVDPVTIVDTLAEDFIVETLAQRRPDDGIRGEEGSSKPAASGVTWIIDPIDGTVNFIYGIPQYAVSVGAAVDGRVVAGAVINVVDGRLYSAARGSGATVEDTATAETLPLRASLAESPARALLGTGFAYSSAMRRTQAELLSTVLPHVRDIRRMGSAALDLCAVAEGRLDAYYEHGIHSWDWAAGALIAEEAGAVVDLPPLSSSGAEGVPAVVMAPGLADKLGEIFRELGVYDPIRPS